MQRSCPSTSRFLVGLAGAPASGKTTLAALLHTHVNAIRPGICAIIPLDGWHYSRAHLRSLPNSQEAFERRGAEWTFDAESYCQFISRLREPISQTPEITIESETEASPPKITAVTAPSFSHALKDPTPDSITVLPTHRLVIIEGLYVFLDTPRWKDGAQLLDERWFVEVDFDEASRRLVKRHVLTGVTDTEEEALHRAQNNDIPNGRFVVANMLSPTRIISSINEPQMDIS